jgi:predicted amidohydrolase
VVLPELASTGYFYTAKEDLIDLAEHPEEGAFSTWARRLSAERGMVMVGGFAERDEKDRLFNSALIAFPDESYAVYRKIHLFYKEKIVFEPGDSGFFVREWNGVRIGTMICYDWRFPEATRALALRGADIVAHPSNLVAAADVWGPAMAIRALENKVIMATANRCGTETVGEESLTFSGESRIIEMNGKSAVIAGPEEECVITAEVDPHATRKKGFNEFNDIFADRRPEMY